MYSKVKRAFENKYQILHEIKKGGFGIVYYGVDKKLNKPVAIKEIAPNLLEDPKYLDMFQEEALNIAKLSHNNIVHIYELIKTDRGHLYIVMEYIDGTDLEKIIRHTRRNKTRIPPRLAVHITAEICTALDYAHQRRDAFTNKPLNLVHQDISPSNIMISHYGSVKLIDFGIASVRRHHKDKKDNKLRGKIPYMAPEQLLSSNEADPRCDLFSLGLVLLETLTGERLFENQEELMTLGRNAKFYKKALKGKKISTPLVRILLKALDPDIERRYQNANHMYIDLLQYLISCNETGELMDDLAEYAGQFGEKQVGVPYETPIDGTSYYSKTPLSTTTTSSSSWENEAPEPRNGALSSALRPATAETDLRRKVQNKEPQVPIKAPKELAREEDDYLKTVIDVMRVERKDSKKKFIRIGFGLVLVALVFGIFDTANHWTRAGTWIYDSLFPPAIKIVSVPPNARLRLDGRPLAGRTPVAIKKISPGVHKLEVSLKNFKPMVKSVFVPREGDIEIQGENHKRDEQTYTFHFVSDVTINSTPPGADIIINGSKLSQQTPARIPWEAGNKMALTLELPGLEALTGYTLDTSAGFDQVDDRRLWDLSVYNDTYKKYVVTGTFRKRVRFRTSPPGASVVDLTEGESVVQARADGTLLLPVGTHTLQFRKTGFKSKTRVVDIDRAFDQVLQVILDRNVTFSSSVTGGAANEDLGATVTSIKANGRELLRAPRQTPFELSLPAVEHVAVFAKPGYSEETVALTATSHAISAKLSPAVTILGINVVDAITKAPISGAQVYYNSVENPQTLAIFLVETGALGKASGKMPPGTYTLKIRKPGYEPLDRMILANPGPTNLTFELSPEN